MNYQSFLFNSLLKEFSHSFKKLPYDEQFVGHLNLLIEFNKSKYQANEEISEYQAICNFLEKTEHSNLIFF